MVYRTLFLSMITIATFSAAEETPSAKTSLPSTITWISTFSAAHRVFKSRSDTYRAAPISSREKCTLEIDMSVVEFETKWSVNHVTATVKLAHIQNVSWHPDDGGIPRSSVRLRGGRSDPAIEEVTKTSDDLTTTTQPMTLDLQFDSANAAAQFGRAISHAVLLCGGRPR